MLNFIICLLEVIILLYVIKILHSYNYGAFNPNPNIYISNPTLGAALGNAANRKFENSQCNLGSCDRGYFSPMFTQPEPIAGFTASPEEKYGISGGGSPF